MERFYLQDSQGVYVVDEYFKVTLKYFTHNEGSW